MTDPPMTIHARTTGKELPLQSATTTSSDLPATALGGFRVYSLAELDRVPIPAKVTILDPWLTTYSATLCFAPSGVGKSWFGLSLAVAIAGGGEVFGWQADRPRKALIVDGELDLLTLRERARRIIPAITNADPATVMENLIFWPGAGQADHVNMPSMSNEDDHEAYVRMVRETGAEFVLLDNLAMLSDVTDENSASAVHPIQKLLKALRHKTGAAALLIHHSKKGGGGEDNFRGSSHLKTVLDMTIELQRVDGGGKVKSKAAEFRVCFHKDRHALAADIFPFTVRLGEDDAGLACWDAETDEDRKIAELLALAKTRQFVSMRALAKTLDVSPMTVTRWLRSATAKGDVTRREFDGWLQDAAAFMRDAGEREEDAPGLEAGDDLTTDAANEDAGVAF
jgi:hypothetical protein